MRWRAREGLERRARVGRGGRARARARPRGRRPDARGDRLARGRPGRPVRRPAGRARRRRPFAAARSRPAPGACSSRRSGRRAAGDRRRRARRRRPARRRSARSRASWRRELGAQVIAVTGSVGKTSTKDLIAALLAPHRTVAASRANFNTEIGMPLEILGARRRAPRCSCSRLAMRGFGQIAELAAICEPDVGVITNIGPVHLEQVGSLEGVARGQGRAARGPARGGTAVVPAGEPLLEPYCASLEVVTFGAGGDVVARRRRRSSRSASGSTSSCRSPPRTTASTRSPRWPRRGPSACARAAASRCASARCAASASSSPGRRHVINDCYNASPLSMRAALDDLARTNRRPPRRGARRHARARRRASASCTARSAPTRRRPGVDVLVTVGPRAAAMLDAFDGESYAVADAGEAAALAGELVEPGRRRARQGLARRRPRGRRRGAAGRRPMGEVLIAGTASLLICVFLSPKFIEFLRAREFGQQIREEGPQEHHAKAGTPTMGGIIIFTAIAVPFLLLTDRDARSLGGLRRRGRVRAARLRRRLHEARQAPLARPARRTKLSSRSRSRSGCGSARPRAPTWPTR